MLPRYYDLNEEEALAVMNDAFSLGCNLYDTAIVPEYGDAEIKLGKFVSWIGREKIIISDKARFLTAMPCTRQCWIHVKTWEHIRIYTLSIRWMTNTGKTCLKKAERWTH